MVRLMITLRRMWKVCLAVMVSVPFLGLGLEGILFYVL